ncbi:MAG: hypothetical protein JOZ96_21225 [Acidobacteria bacterium]|nr:hypothetical protein [Acidobacteriota bacterium]
MRVVITAWGCCLLLLAGAGVRAQRSTLGDNFGVGKERTLVSRDGAYFASDAANADQKKRFALGFEVAAVCVAQGDKDRGKLTPTPDPEAPFKVYVPKDLEDCLVELEKMLHPSLISEMRLKSEDDMVLYHRSLGTWVRNNWALWAGSRLSRYFNGLGIYHPDDMSGIILTSFWRHLHSQPIRLDEQVERYKKYWRDLEEKEDSISPGHLPRRPRGQKNPGLRREGFTRGGRRGGRRTSER